MIAPPPHLKLLLFLASFSYGQTEGSSYVLFVQQSREKGRTRNTKLRQQGKRVTGENKGEEAVSSFFHCVVLSQCGIFPKCEEKKFNVVLMIELSNIFRISLCKVFAEFWCTFQCDFLSKITFFARGPCLVTHTHTHTQATAVVISVVTAHGK